MNYGLCYTCGAPVIDRTRGIPCIDTCERGHRHPASLTCTPSQRNEIERLRRLVAQAYVEGVAAGRYCGVTPEQATNPMHLPSTDWWNWLNDSALHDKEGGE